MSIAYTVLSGITFGFALVLGLGDVGGELLAVACLTGAGFAFSDFMWEEC